MREDENLLNDLTSGEYKYGFTTDIETEVVPMGINEEIIRLISAKKEEPEWLLEFRLKAYRKWKTMEMPRWAHLDIPEIDYQKISYYAAPRKNAPGSLDEVDPELLKTFEKLGIPLEEQKALSGMAVDAVMDSVSVKTTFRDNLAELGIIFCSKGAKWLYQYLSTFDYFSENITMLICYIAAFLLIAGIVLLAGEIASKIIGATPLSIINHLTGGFFGLSVMVIFLSLVLNIADAIDKESLLLTKSVKEESRFFYPVKGLLPAIFPSEWFSLRTFNSHTPDIV